MLTQEKEYVSATVLIRVVGAAEDGLFRAPQNRVDENADFYGHLFEFAGSAPVTFAERFPRLMVFGVAAAFVMAAIALEIEWLRGAGFYWR